MVAKFRAPGMYRAFLYTAYGIVLAYGIIWAFRTWYNLDPLFKGEAVLELALFLAPLGFLVGLGAFSYWFYWASGKRTLPEDHSGHGAHSWRDYFRVTTAHKVLGLQSVVNSFFFFFVGGLVALPIRVALAPPVPRFLASATLNPPFRPHASPA